jgi:hypothetical protein
MDTLQQRVSSLFSLNSNNDEVGTFEGLLDYEFMKNTRGREHLLLDTSSD